MFEIENAKLEKKCCDLVNAFQNIKCEKDEALIEIEALKSQNKILAEYIENKFPNDNFTNSGKVFDDLKTRQISRKIRTLETYAQKALWFAESFGIMPEKLICKSKAGKDLTLNLNTKTSSESSSFQNLSESEKQKIRQLVFILDKFCISDAAYHELTMIFDDMPRKYLLLQSRDDIYSLSHIERLPGNVPGAFVSLTAELEKLVKYEMKKSTNCSKLDIKFSGDGTKVSRTSNFIIFSMSAVSDDQKLSYHQLFTVGIVKCEEKYENLAATCQPIFHELCNLTQTKTI